MERIKEPWMQYIMQACQEISKEEVDAYRSCGALDPGHLITERERHLE